MKIVYSAPFVDRGTLYFAEETKSGYIVLGKAFANEVAGANAEILGQAMIEFATSLNWDLKIILAQYFKLDRETKS